MVFDSVEFEGKRPRSGWAEQDQGQWWSTLRRASKGALKKGGVAPEDIPEDEGDRPPLPQHYRIARSRPVAPGLRVLRSRAN